MRKPSRLLRGDTIAIVSLSSGVLGEDFASHQLLIAEKRLNSIFGLNVQYMKHSLHGINYLSKHPEARAKDLKQAMLDDNIKAIIVATGGDDTYKTIPYLMNDEEFIGAVKTNPKIFLGFSDTTNNHIMFHKLGMPTFYGLDFLSDFGELDMNMLPYTEACFRGMFFEACGTIEIKSSPEWYKKRSKYSIDQINISREIYKEKIGIEVLCGHSSLQARQGKLFGGCIESLYEMVSGDRFKDQPQVTKGFSLLPPYNAWHEKVLFLESSEAQSTPDKLRHMLDILNKHINYDSLKGVIVGKPQDNIFYEEYRKVWQDFAIKFDVPVFYNVNFGHSYPHCILPYDAEVKLDVASKSLSLISDLFSDR